MQPLTSKTDIKIRRKRILINLFSLLFLIVLPMIFIYYLRGTSLVHGPFLFFYANPVTWKLPLIFFLVSFLVASIPLWLKNIHQFKNKIPQSRKNSSSYFFNSVPSKTPEKLTDFAWIPLMTERTGYYRSTDKRPSNQLIAAIFFAFVGFFIALLLMAPLNGKATYNYYQFSELKTLPATDSVRIMPFQVAERLTGSGYNSSTSKLVKPRIIFEDGKLTWTFLAAPSGGLRYFLKKSEGRLTQNAETTSREVSFKKYKYRYSENTGIKDNLFLRLYQRDYFSKVDEAILLKDGSIVVPKIKYKGSIFSLSKAPYLASVYLIEPGGQINELSLSEAQNNQAIKETGRLFPESLARDIQKSYQYKNGLLNSLFFHEDQIEITDFKDNSQPYLMSFKSGPAWVSTAKPYGKSNATRAIFLTNSLTGKNEVWFSKDRALSGPARAVEAVRGLAIDGVNFNNFKAIEPRPLIKDSNLYFLISIVPNNNSAVTKSVIVDAKTNKVVQIFDHDQDPESDQELRNFVINDLKYFDKTDSILKNENKLKSISQNYNLSNQEINTLIKNIKESINYQKNILKDLEDILSAKG